MPPTAERVTDSLKLLFRVRHAHIIRTASDTSGQRLAKKPKDTLKTRKNPPSHLQPDGTIRTMTLQNGP